jgi:hypothetical protein
MPSDLTLFGDVFHDKKAVHLSLLVAGVSAKVCVAVLVWRGLKHYRRSLDYLREWSESKRVNSEPNQSSIGCVA